jgi:large repetitive protein
MTFSGSLAGVNAALDGMRFDPDANYNGSATLTITTDDQGNSGAGGARTDADTVNISVNAVNDAPEAGSNSYKVKEDKTLKVRPPGVLGNDTDPDGDALTAKLVSGPSKGRLTLNADGSFTYKPKRNFHGTVSFTYGAGDGTAERSAAVVSIKVLAVRG